MRESSDLLATLDPEPPMPRGILPGLLPISGPGHAPSSSTWDRQRAVPANDGVIHMDRVIDVPAIMGRILMHSWFLVTSYSMASSVAT